MEKGHVWAAEWKSFNDAKTGVHVCQLTNYKGHSNHLYFTNNGWYDGGRKLLFGSDRNNKANLFSIDLQSGAITQLTDLVQFETPYELEFLTACVNPIRNEAYFWHHRQIKAIDLDTLQERLLYEMPEAYLGHIMNCTADGKYICTSIFEDLSSRLSVDYLNGYVGFKETCEMKPLSKVLRISTEDEGSTVVYQNNVWIAHVNTSPTLKDIITYCHEGPWDLVDNRIWGLNIHTGETWKIRPRKMENERVGHEYWHADGIHIGYHGHRPDGEKIFGKIRWDNTENEESSFPFHTGHIHSNDYSLIVGDGQGKTTSVRLWKWNGHEFIGPRSLCEHRGSFQVQKLHVHPRFNAEGTKVLFVSDMNGYGNIYLADVPEFESLPELKD
jgi:oligogalacturonide lyase